MEDRPLLWDEEADLEEKQESQRSVCTESPAISGVLLGEGFIRPIIASPHRSAVASGHVRGGTWRRNNAAESAEKKILNGDAIGKLKIDMEEERSESSFESFNYDEHHSLVRQIWLRNRSEREIRNEAISRWILTFLVAITMAFIAIGVRWSSVQIAAFKFSFVQEMINSQKWISAGFFFVGFNILLVTAASILISFVEPVAAGSGIPEIKCTLNGIKIPRIVRFKTLLVKSLGMIGTVSASMPVGMEGPMIHAGAICGAGISQGKSTTMKWSCITKKPFRPFRNDREKRDFISCGAAAGVACAFGAPIGGVLFSLEEGSSFWNLSLTWRTFFCAMSCAFLYNVLWIRLQTAGDRLGESNMFVFGDVIGLQSSAQYSFFEVIFFIAMGVMGGAFGALYNYLNEKLTLWRFRNLKRSWMRVAEASIVCLFISTVSFILPFLIGSCIQDGDLTKKAENMTVKFNCPTSFHNDLATLMFNQADLSIKSLLHSQHQSFSFLSLSIFFVVFFLFSCWTYGISIPGGLFVPNLLAGAAFGRLVGQGLEICMHPVQPVSAETYALIGAAAMLGGMARMTISLTVILIEATGDLRHGLPIMVTLLTSKWIGDFFNHGLYDIHIKLKRLPFLEWFSPQIANFLLAMDIMNTQVVCFREVERVSTILRALKKNSHHGFPVVNTGSNHRQRSFRGLILRKHLCMILKHRAFFESKPIAYETRPSLGEDDFESVYPRYPAIDDISLPSRFLNYWVDLTPYMNPAPYVIQEHSPVSHTFSIFRTMGLRHLCVVNKMNELVGMITRKDLTDFVLRRQVHDLLNPAPDSPVSSRASSSTVYSFVKNLDLIKKSPSSSENLKLLPSSSENI